MPSRRLPVFHIDAFSDRGAGGNPAAVVLEGGSLPDTELQRLARELHRGDTAFVLAPETAGNDLRLRFFTPTREVPFIGHCTIAAHYALGIDCPDRPRHVRQETGAGVMDVTVRGDGDDRVVAMSLEPPALGRVIAGNERLAVLEALGVGLTDLDSACTLQIASKGSSRLLIGLRSTSQLDRLKPNLAMLKRLSAELIADGYFVFVRQSSGDALTESRMFCPAIGIDEDPVSGNAHGMLGVYLFEHGLLGGAKSFAGRQGRAVGRPGRVEVELELHHARIASVTIAGRATLVSRETRAVSI